MQRWNIRSNALYTLDTFTAGSHLPATAQSTTPYAATLCIKRGKLPSCGLWAAYAMPPIHGRERRQSDAECPERRRPHAHLAPRPGDSARTPEIYNSIRPRSNAWLPGPLDLLAISR